jgi:hypothetical protein
LEGVHKLFTAVLLSLPPCAGRLFFVFEGLKKKARNSHNFIFVEANFSIDALRPKKISGFAAKLRMRSNAQAHFFKLGGRCPKTHRD